ncbi:TPA: NAD-dependent epimerase/dehydratase family protein [Vibrio vulnificus]|nr:NAD-dependent epimerase/dehydratase family protein [Vibrio vulnificus]
MKKVIITGGEGFIGRNFPDYFERLDLRLDNELRKLADCNSLIHLAGLAHGTFTADDYQRNNVDLSVGLCKSAINFGVKRFVYLSSVNVCKLFFDDLKSTDLSALSKYHAERALIEFGETNDIEIVIVRAPLVYGPEAPGNFGVLTKFVNSIPLLPFGLATNRRDFISVQNLADLLVTCATHPNAAGHTFLASDGETVSIKEFTNAIAKGLGKKVIQLPVPVTLMRLAGKLTGKSAMIEQLYGDLEVDSSNIKEVLGWTPPFTMEQSMALLKHTDK